MSMNEQFRTALINALTEDGIDVENVRKMVASYDRISADWAIDKMSTELIPVKSMWENVLRNYIACKAVEGMSVATLKNKTYILRKMFFCSGKDIDTITTSDIRGWLFSMMRNGVSERTCETYRTTASSFFRWCVSEGVLSCNPSEKINKIHYDAKQRYALTKTEVEILRQVLKDNYEKAIVEFMLSTGCRVSELCCLTMDCLDLQNGVVHLFGKGKKHRDSFLNAKATITLEEYLASRKDNDPHVFVPRINTGRSGVSKDGVELMFRKIEKRLNGRIAKRITPHILRHTFATLMLQNGGDMKTIQTILGHSSMDTTSIYAEISMDKIKAEHSRLVS